MHVERAKQAILVKFPKLENGSVFTYNNFVYIKIQYNGEYNSILASSGALVRIDSDIVVIHEINAKLVLD